MGRMKEFIVVKTSYKNTNASSSGFVITALIIIMSLVRFSDMPPAGQIPLGILLFAVVFIQFAGWYIGGRTLKFDKEGITVQASFFKRKYKWGELKTKRYAINNSTILSSRDAYRNTYAAEFSTKKLKRFRWLDSIAYSKWHPFSYIFVTFPAEGEEETLDSHWWYPTDEREFGLHLLSWNVELEEYENVRKRDKWYNRSIYSDARENAEIQKRIASRSRDQLEDYKV